MTSNIGWNLEFAVVKNRDVCLQRIGLLKPAWCLTYNISDAKAITEASPETNVIIRHFPDGNVNPKLSADQWMKKYEGVAKAGYHIESTNEDGLQISWLTDPQKGILPAALKRGWKICAPGLQTGVPEPDEWPSVRPFFDLLAQYPNQLRFSFHEYFSAVPISGMAGKRLDSELAKSWSPEMPLPDKSQHWWHAGRMVDFGFAYLDANNLPHPPMVITELGMATMTDQKPWLQTLKKTPPYQDNSNGWLAMSNQFQEWWPDVTPARRYAQMLIWLDKNIYRPNNIPCIVYCYGADWNRPPGSEQDWKPFDIEAYPEIFDELLAYANSTPAPVSPPASPPPVSPPPSLVGTPKEVSNEYWVPVTIAPTGPFANVRGAPSLHAKQVWQMLEPMAAEIDLFEIVMDTNTPDSTLRWFKFRTATRAVAYSRSDVVTITGATSV